MDDLRERAEEALDPDEVHVWYAFTDEVRGADAIAACDALLSAEERARRDRFVFDRDRHVFRVSWALVRRTLSRYAPVDPAAWTFERNAHGKPEIAAGLPAAGLRFNLSHTAGLAACAVHRRRDVGVDVETLRRESATREIAERSFAPDEVAALERLPEERRREAFFDYWTLKEAYIKAVGVGISLGLQRFAFDLAGPGTPRVRFAPDLHDDPEGWQFAQDRPGPDHRAAVAVRAPRGEPLRWSFRRTVPTR